MFNHLIFLFNLICFIDIYFISVSLQIILHIIRPVNYSNLRIMSVLELYFIHTLQFILFFQQRMLHHLNKFFIIFCPFEEVKYLLHIFFCAVSGHFSVKGVYNFLFFFG